MSFLGKSASAVELHIVFVADALKSGDDMWMLHGAYTAFSVCGLDERQTLLSFSNYSKKNSGESWQNLTPSGLILTLRVEV